MQLFHLPRQTLTSLQDFDFHSATDEEISDVAKYVDSQAILLSEFAGFRQKNREILSNGDVLQHHSFDNQEGIHVEQLQRYMKTPKGIYIATCSHLAGELFEMHADRFRELLLSIESS
jgi:hypothetical protein